MLAVECSDAAFLYSLPALTPHSFICRSKDFSEAKVFVYEFIPALDIFHYINNAWAIVKSEILTSEA